MFHDNSSLAYITWGIVLFIACIGAFRMYVEGKSILAETNELLWKLRSKKLQTMIDTELCKFGLSSELVWQRIQHLEEFQIAIADQVVLVTFDENENLVITLAGGHIEVISNRSLCDASELAAVVREGMGLPPEAAPG